MAERALPNAFAMNAGELSPLMANRVDQARYAYGARRMRNFIPRLQGPASKRPGTRFVGEIADSDNQAWLIPFVYSQTDAYQLEFGDETVRFYTDNGQVLEATKAISGATQASPGVIAITGHGYSVGDEIVIASVGGMTQLNGRNYRVRSVPDADHVTLEDLYGVAIDTSAFTAYTSGGTAARVYTLASPYPASALTESSTGCCLISFAQSQDVIYLCVPGYAVQKLTRAASNSWAFSTLDQTAGPFESVDPDETITVYASAVSGTGITLTASSGIFNANHVGALFLLEKKLSDTVGAWETGKAVSLNDEKRSQGHYYICTDAGTTGTVTPSHTEGGRYDGSDTSATAQWTYIHSGYGWVKITGYTSPTQVTADVMSRIPSQAVGSGNATTAWAFGAWSDDAGHPTQVAYFRERLFFARGTKLWGSVPSDFENFAQRDAGIVADDSAISIDIRSGQGDDITGMLAVQDLIVLTEGGEFAISEISSSSALSPTNIAAIPGPGYGARRVTPIKINGAVLYAQNAGRTIREMAFSFESNNYVSADRTAFAEHIAKGKVTQMAFAKQPESIIWMACANGDLPALSNQAEHQLLAWHKHPIGGSFDDGAAIVESVGVIPAPDGSRDQVWLIVKRTINEQTKRYVEFIEDYWDEDDDVVADMFYSDCGLTYDGSASTTITGAHHLEGESVQVFADGRYLGTKTVTDGAITLTNSASKVQLGLSYTAVLQSMNVVRVGVFARIVRAFLRVLSSIGGAFGEAENETREVTFMRVNDALSGPSTAYTGMGEAIQGGKHEREAYWTFVHTAPTAATVLGVIPEIVSTTDR